MKKTLTQQRTRKCQSVVSCKMFTQSNFQITLCFPMRLLFVRMVQKISTIVELVSGKSPLGTDGTHSKSIKNYWLGRYSKQQIDRTLFFDSNLTVELYLHLLWTSILTDLIQVLSDPNNTQHSNPWLFFQQVGGLLRYNLQVRTFVDPTINGRWIGRRRPIELPPSSPNLTPINFSCGTI